MIRHSCVLLTVNKECHVQLARAQAHVCHGCQSITCLKHLYEVLCSTHTDTHTHIDTYAYVDTNNTENSSRALNFYLLSFWRVLLLRLTVFYRCSFVSRLSDRAHVRLLVRSAVRSFVCVCLFLCVVINFYIYYVYVPRIYVHTNMYFYISILYVSVIFSSLQFTRWYFNSPRCCHLYSVHLVSSAAGPSPTTTTTLTTTTTAATIIIIENAVNAGCIQSRVLCTCICIFNLNSCKKRRRQRRQQ